LLKQQLSKPNNGRGGDSPSILKIKVMDTKDKLIEVLKEFIESLIKEYAMFNHVHGLVPSKEILDTREQYKEKIDSLEKQIKAEKKTKK
jgi:hypothetical protein